MTVGLLVGCFDGRIKRAKGGLTGAAGADLPAGAAKMGAATRRATQKNAWIKCILVVWLLIVGVLLKCNNDYFLNQLVKSQ